MEARATEVFTLKPCFYERQVFSMNTQDAKSISDVRIKKICKKEIILEVEFETSKITRSIGIYFVIEDWPGSEDDPDWQKVLSILLPSGKELLFTAKII